MNSHEQFLFELKGRGFNFQDTSYTEFGFNNEILNMVYEMYIAGYDKYMLLSKKHGSTIGKLHFTEKKLAVTRKEISKLKEKLSKYEH